MILIDTSGLLAALDRRDPLHPKAATALRGVDGPLLLSPFVLCELDYLLGRHVGPHVSRALLDEVANGSYLLEPFTARDVEEATDVLARYADLQIGLTDASLVVLAHRHGVLDVLTLDERHFRVLRGPGNRPFRLLPADAG
jgi:uncharacterized protein